MYDRDVIVIFIQKISTQGRNFHGIYFYDFNPQMNSAKCNIFLKVRKTFFFEVVNREYKFRKISFAPNFFSFVKKNFFFYI